MSALDLRKIAHNKAPIRATGEPAKAFGVGFRYVSDAKAIREKAPDRWDAIRRRFRKKLRNGINT